MAKTPDDPPGMPNQKRLAALDENELRNLCSERICNAIRRGSGPALTERERSDWDTKAGVWTKLLMDLGRYVSKETLKESKRVLKRMEAAAAKIHGAKPARNRVPTGTPPAGEVH